MADVALAIQSPPPTGKSFAKGSKQARKKPFAGADEIPHLLPKMVRDVQKTALGAPRLFAESAKVVAAGDAAPVRAGRTIMG